MVHLRILAVVGLVLAMGVGCAVTEPDDSDTSRVRAAFGEGADVSIPGLASELGISQVAVVEAMPESMRVALPTNDLPALLPAVCEVGPVSVRFAGVVGGSSVMFEGRVSVHSFTDDRLVLQGEGGSPSIDLSPHGLAYVSLVRTPPGRGDGSGRWVYFFGSAGEPVMVWGVPGDPAAIRAFDRLWSRFAQ
ncbi:MAG: ChuX/HutX family heme-like substrate-binding protein [Phycisphaerales bacterium JB063]